MNNRIDIRLQNIRVPRVYQHLLFWAVVYVLVASLYSVQTNFAVSMHNNLYFMPLQIAYYYAIAYWLIPGTCLLKSTSGLLLVYWHWLSRPC